MEEVKFEGLVNLTSEENDLLKHYIDQKIDAALTELRNDIRDLRASKVSRGAAVTRNDIKDIMSIMKGRR